MVPSGLDRFRSKAAALPEFGAGSGGEMDDIPKRVGILETAIVEFRTKLDAVLPHLATKADLAALRCEVKAEIGALRTEMKADFGAVRTEAKADVCALRADMHAMETRLIKWIVGALLSGIAVAVGIAQVISHLLK